MRALSAICSIITDWNSMGSDFTSPVRANTACRCNMRCLMQKTIDRATVQSAATTWQRDVQDELCIPAPRMCGHHESSTPGDCGKHVPFQQLASRYTDNASQCARPCCCSIAARSLSSLTWEADGKCLVLSCRGTVWHTAAIGTLQQLAHSTIMELQWR